MATTVLQLFHQTTSMKVFLILLLVFFSTAFTEECVRPQRTTPESCVNPPVIRRVNIPAYTGRWFNTYVSGTAREFAFACATANYTLDSSGNIDVLNCFYTSGRERPTCLRGIAARRPGLPSSRLTVSFNPRDPPGNYNIAALLGKKNYGYFAAAVYSCSLEDGFPREGVFIIVRAPFAPAFVFRRLRKKLRCMGYLLEDEFVQLQHNRTCVYFDGGRGFDNLASEDFTDGSRTAP